MLFLNGKNTLPCVEKMLWYHPNLFEFIKIHFVSFPMLIQLICIHSKKITSAQNKVDLWYRKNVFCWWYRMLIFFKISTFVTASCECYAKKELLLLWTFRFAIQLCPSFWNTFKIHSPVWRKSHDMCSSPTGHLHSGTLRRHNVERHGITRRRRLYCRLQQRHLM